MSVVDLRAVRGTAMLAGFPLTGDEPDGRLWGLPPELVDGVQEWARSADALPGPGSPRDPAAVLVSRQGRHLAARLSVRLRVPVDYCDPVTGHRIPLRGLTRFPSAPFPGAPSPSSSSPGSSPGVPPVPSLRPERVGNGGPVRTAGPVLPPLPGGPAGEPTPWSTGLLVALLVAGLVLAANLALALPMVASLGAVGVLVDVLVVAGLVPALWLNRYATTWRWAVFGTLAGMVLALPPIAIAGL